MPVAHGGQVYSAARAVGLAHDPAVLATAIAKGESGWNTDARATTAKEDSIGLWQINTKAHGDTYGTVEQLTDIMVNARAMAALSNGGTNWQPWTVYKSGEYRRHMAAAKDAAHKVALPPTDPAKWETIAREGTSIVRKVGAPDIPKLVGDIIADPGSIGGIIGALNPLDDLTDIASMILRTLADPAWWRRVGVGVLGAALVAAGLLWLGRDLITDTARSIVSEVAP